MFVVDNLLLLCFLATEGAKTIEKQKDEEDLEHLIRNGTGYCLDPVPNKPDSAILTAVCFSPPMQLKAGQVNAPTTWLCFFLLLFFRVKILAVPVLSLLKFLPNHHHH